MKMEDQIKKIEKELIKQERLIEGDNIVVDNAKIGCCYAQSGRAKWESTRLTVKANGYGSNVSGPYIIATEKDCKKTENLHPYTRCYSPYYMDMVRKLYANDAFTANEENKKYNKYLKLKSDYIDQGYGECLHFLEEVWFEPSEKVIVNNMYLLEERLLKIRTLQGGLDGDIHRMREQIAALRKEIPVIIKEEQGSGYYHDSALARRYRLRLGKMDTAITDMEKTVSQIEEKAEVFGYAEKTRLTSKKFLNNYENVYQKLQRLDRELHVLTDQDTWDVGTIDVGIPLGMASNLLKEDAESPERTPEYIVSEIKILPCYTELKAVIDALIRDLQEIIEHIENWTTDYSRVLTTDSFMVCRCGGILEFLSSGQEYVAYFNNLYIRTLEIADSLIKHFQTFAETQDLFGYEDERYEPKYAYGNASRMAVRAYEYLTEGGIRGEKDEQIPCNIHFEFVGKSVKEEEGQYLAALLTVMGHFPNVLGGAATLVSVLLSVYDHLEGEMKGKEIVSATCSVIGDECETALEDLGAPYALDAKGIRGNLSIITDTFNVISALHYEIYDNWVYSIRVYTFTEEYLFYAEQFLDKDCQKVGEIRFLPGVERDDYMNERRGSNIAWGEDPGVTYSIKTRVGAEGKRKEFSQNTFDGNIQEEKVYD